MDFTETESQAELAALSRKILTDRVTPQRLAAAEADGDRFDAGLWADPGQRRRPGRRAARSAGRGRARPAGAVLGPDRAGAHRGAGPLPGLDRARRRRDRPVRHPGPAAPLGRARGPRRADPDRRPVRGGRRRPGGTLGPRRARDRGRAGLAAVRGQDHGARGPAGRPDPGARGDPGRGHGLPGHAGRRGGHRATAAAHQRRQRRAGRAGGRPAARGPGARRPRWRRGAAGWCPPGPSGCARCRPGWPSARWS